MELFNVDFICRFEANVCFVPLFSDEHLYFGVGWNLFEFEKLLQKNERWEITRWEKHAPSALVITGSPEKVAGLQWDYKDVVCSAKKKAINFRFQHAGNIPIKV